MAGVTLRGLTKAYGRTQVLHGIDLDIADGEFVVLVGPSGCGKSTTLRMIAGLEEITAGEVSIGGRVVNRLAPKARNIAMVFQNYAIYPHMTVAQNIGFGLYSSGLDRAAKAERIAEAARILDLGELLARRPAQLSGGQRQRVAIGRAMVRDPAVFLFDEPLSNLDAQLRAQMRIEIKKLHQNLGRTVVYVTHDQVEAMTLADRIVVMKDGHIRQVATPDEAYRAPADVFVAQFIGSPSMNLLAGTVSAGGRVELEGGTRLAVEGAAGEGRAVLVGVRPQDLKVGGEGALQLPGKVTVAEPLGPEVLVYAEAGGREVIASAPGRSRVAAGQMVRLAAAAEDLHLFDRESGKTLR